MFSISADDNKSLTFCVMPVGTPPHFRNRFHISTEYLAVCSSPKANEIHLCSSVGLFVAVQSNSAPNLVLNNEHCNLLELTAELFNVKADKSVTDVNVGAV